MKNPNMIITAEGKTLDELETLFGSFDFEGKTYVAAEEMDRTCELFFGSIHDAEEGESYLDEWKARGYDEDGNEVRITMRFEQIRGSELEDDCLPWSKQDAYRVENA